MIKDRLEEDLKAVLKELGIESSDIVLHSSQKNGFGDYSSNVALQQSKQNSDSQKHSSIEIAKKIVDRVQDAGESFSYLDKVEVAGPGFINFYIKDQVLVKELAELEIFPKNQPAKKILVEYGHTNPLKEVHIGHLRTFILGEAVSRIFEGMGNQVFRANYQGDIGLHIAKAIWGVKKLGLPSEQLDSQARAKFMGSSYAEGNQSYEKDPEAKDEIDQINKGLYLKDPNLMEIYKLTRDWSLEYFEPIYALLGIKYDRCFFESEVYEKGKELVLSNVPQIFEESQGAVIFPGEKYGLHSRVFITNSGNPTYEGKELGLGELEYQTFNYDTAIHVVAHEQAGYFEVVFKALEQLFPYLKGKKQHLSYGLVDLKEGKMSSRTGNVITVDDLYKVVLEKVRETMKDSGKEIDQEVARQVAIGAIKYSYLKVSPTPNMIFDLEDSVSLHGDSGPYLQYTYARIQSILNNSSEEVDYPNDTVLDPEERVLLVKLNQFSEVALAASQFRPNLICEYLAELAQSYNLFYQKHRVIGSEKQDFRLALTKSVGEVIKVGLNTLGIETPQKM